MPNKGLEYEKKIRELLMARELLPAHLLGKLIKTGNDAAFVHKGKGYFLEIKNETAPDYGAKKIIYKPDTGKWAWNEIDEMSDLFDEIGVLNKIPSFVPRKHVKPDLQLTAEDKKFDLKNFTHIIQLGIVGANLLHEYYAKKRCFYIQVEGKGFYHLLEDRAELGVPKFNPVVNLRLRAKTHSSTPIHNYSFRVIILGLRQTILASPFDLEKGTKFPPIDKDLAV
ncbi:MAG TPA: hypothetical protein VGB02_11885 [Pyrinomonadaceae bacterium]|jgi:hypothetical protein